MPFEVFNRKSAGRSSDPNVTIQKRGTFSMNSAAARALSGGEEFEKLPLELLFDREEQAVGLRRAEPGSPNIYYLRKMNASESYILAGQAFTVFYKIDTTVARRFRAKMTEDGMLFFKLTDKHVEVERTGRPSRDEFAELEDGEDDGEEVEDKGKEVEAEG